MSFSQSAVRGSRSLALAFLASLTLLLAASRARAAAPPMTDPAFDREIRRELAAVDPDAVGLLDRADQARDADQMESAAGLYGQLLERVPQFHHAARRLCTVELARNDRPHALTLCRKALAIKDTPENHAALAWALLSTKDPSSSEVQAAGVHARSAVASTPRDARNQQVLCRYAMAANDMAAMHGCSTALLSIAEKDPTSHFLASISAASEGRFDDADAELERAHELGLPGEMYQGLRSSLADARPRGPIYLRWGALTLAAWFALFGVLFAGGSLLSASAMRASRRLPTSDDGHARGVDGLLRRFYRLVLWASCGFYYLSLPLLAVFMVVAGLAVGYATLMVGHVPIKLLLIVGVIILSTLVAIVRSLFIRGTDRDPGDRIDLAEHPRMREVLDEVAARIGTRPVDHVYLTPFTDIAVLERGGMARQLRGSTERALVLGAGVLDGMKLRAFKGILAHEYGHFHNEDTAGGGFALAVRRSVLTMAIGLAQRGAASSLNPAWWFVKGFYAVFLRISQGASRLQEVLADRWAAFAYGSHAFEEGLRHVVRRSLAFDAHADHTLAEVMEQKSALANLYRYAPAVQPSSDDVEKAFAEAWNAAPSPYDSHPRPADRIEWVRALDARGCEPLPGDDDDAWSLFSDRAKVEEHMTAVVRERVATATGVHLPAGAERE